AATCRPRGRAASQFSERPLRPPGRPDHHDQRLQEADQGRQPAGASGYRARGRQGVAGHPHQGDGVGRSGSQEAGLPGTTIYDFDVPVPNLPNNPNGGNLQATIKGPISLAIAKETLFVTTDTTLLEQILRPGGVPLAESPTYQTVAKEIPQKVSGMTFVRPDEQARLSYDMIKSG